MIHFGMAHLIDAPLTGLVVPWMVAAVAGVLLLAGVCTPLAGALAAVAEVWIAFSLSGATWIAVMLAGLGATLAMIGPGAYSVDARIFGRKEIQIHQPVKRDSRFPR